MKHVLIVALVALTTLLTACNENDSSFAKIEHELSVKTDAQIIESYGMYRFVVANNYSKPSTAESLKYITSFTTPPVHTQRVLRYVRKTIQDP